MESTTTSSAPSLNASTAPPLAAPVFSDKLEAAVASLVPCKDPLDAAEFDAVDYVNRLFPDANAVNQLEPVLARLKAMMARTDEEILRQVRRQSLASAKGQRELDLAKQSMGDLFKQIGDIRTKAERSERMVDDICRDIKSLDYAKKNLTTSITTLKRLNMLVTGVGQLKTMAAKRQYKECGSLLQAVASLSICFEDFQHIARIQEARKQFEALKEECSNLVYSEFEALDHHAATPPYFADLCVVMEALGKQEQLHFMSWFVKDRLLDYEQTFKEGDEHSKLENIKARFQWLKRELQFYQEHFESTFPKSWEMPQLLCEEFCHVTKDKISRILNDLRVSGRLSVGHLTDTMKATLAFEKELNKRFRHARVGTEPIPSSSSSTASSSALGRGSGVALDGSASSTTSGAMSADQLRQKWKRIQEERAAAPAATSSSSALGSVAADGGEAQMVPSTRFTRIISAVFEAYLDIYVAYEDKEMQGTLQTITRSDAFEDRNMVYSSSQAMFDQFKNVMDTCVGLSRGLAFFQISEMFRTYLRAYGEYLMGKLQKLDGGSAAKDKEDEKSVCFVVNTAEYCTTTVEELAETIRQGIDTELVAKVDFSTEQDRFQTVVARGMQALVRLLETRMAPALTKMQKTNWSSWESVVDQSEYVGMIESEIRECSAVFHKWLSKGRFGFFCDSFANSFIPRLREAIFGCKQISEVGAEQLLLDLAHVKQILDGLPRQGAGADRAPARYKKIVQKDMHKIERVLKVVLAPKEGILDTYLMLMPKGTAQELQRILDLKGIKKADVCAQILDEFSRRKQHGDAKKDK